MRRIMLTKNPSPTFGGISLSEWQAYLSQSTQFHRPPPVHGVNPFTKQPKDYHASPGSVFFVSTSGKCTIEYQEGTLLASVPDEAAMAVVNQIAIDLHATMENSPV